MEYQRASDAAAFSKKLNNGRSFNGKSMYDGVFGGQSRVGTRVEDYAEIFSGASGSSIPVLDVPELNQRKFSVDVSSSKLDYSNIFGGFRDFDFAVSHDELIAKPTRDKKRQAKTRSHSEGSFSNPPSIPLGNQVLLNDQSSNESGNGVKQFKMSFNKSIPGSKHGSNGTTHVAELHAVPGYTRLIDDRITPSRDKSVPSVVNEPYGTNNFDQGKMEGMQCKKPVSNVPSTDFSKQASEGVDEWHGESRSNGSDPNDVLFGFYDVGRRTPPSKVRRASSMSYNMDGNKRDSLKFGVSRSHSFDGDAGVSSPPYFDDEVDANSVAATSAAAVKKAIEEAQARLKVAKEMMERRKEGHIGRFKPSSNGSLKAKESKKSKDTIKQNNSGQDIAQERCENMDGSVQTCAGLRKQSVMKVGKVAAESEDREKSFIAEEAAGGTCAKNFISSQADCRQEEEKKSEAAKEGEREKDGMQALCEYEQEKKITENPEKYGEKLELLEGKVDASQELCDKEECLHKLKPDLEFHDEKEDETKLKFSERREETEEKVCIELEACERKLEDQENPTEDERKVEMQDLKDIDNLERRTADQESVDKGEKHEHMLKQEENGYALGDVFEKEENEMLQQDVSIQNEEEKICEEAFEISELKEGHQGACGPEENNEDNEQISDKMEKPEIFGLRYNGFDYEEERERRLEENGDSMGNEEFMEAEENGDLFKDAYQMEAVEEGQEEAPEKVGTEEMQKQTEQKVDETTEGNEDLFKDAYQTEMVEEGQKEIPEKVGTEEMQNQIDQKVDETTEGNEDLFKDAYQTEMVEEGQEEAPERVGTEEMQKQTDQKADETAEGNEDLFKDAYQMEMVEEGQKEIPERVGIEEMQNQTDRKADETTEENGDLFKDAYRMEAVEGGGKEVPERVGAEEMQKQTVKNVDETTAAGEDALGCCRDDLEAANDAYDDNEIIDLDETLEPAGNEHSCEMTPELLVNEENGEIAEGSKACTECKETRRDSEAVEVANYLEENLAFKKADLAGSNLNLSEIEQQKVNRKQEFDFYRVRIDNHTGDTTFEQNQYEQHSEESEIICTREKHVEELASESEENSRQAEFGLKQEYNKCNFEISDEGRSVDSQLHCKFGEKHETMQIADEIEASQSTGYNEESHHGTLTKEEGDTKNSSHEEVKLVKEQQRRIDEAKEKERERERERLAVERAIREARGRAFAEARERAAAGRTNVEARRKVKGEAQGESAKPSADANDKTFMEAKIKAERAAVERANAEARQRALRKALSEKASFGARKQAEKLSDANQSFQSYDSPYKGAYPPATTRYPNSTNQSASNSSEGLDGASGESTQRCKARLERHRRTAERAAKALAEKNKRDLLAQKEQDERTRLAETVDAEVKRWSSGKRGNLRALLSTLQYILGPDSGWQPIPLTDIIATAAVKKAYRKATLCVHPDKLQQRGASIQQKYTCEKVFDLLKEAWNKFSAEER